MLVHACNEQTVQEQAMLAWLTDRWNDLNLLAFVKCAALNGIKTWEMPPSKKVGIAGSFLSSSGQSFALRIKRIGTWIGSLNLFPELVP